MLSRYMERRNEAAQNEDEEQAAKIRAMPIVTISDLIALAHEHRAVDKQQDRFAEIRERIKEFAKTNSQADLTAPLSAKDSDRIKQIGTKRRQSRHSPRPNKAWTAQQALDLLKTTFYK